MSCFDCGKTNYDEALELIKQQAKRAAVEENEPKAIYKDGSEYKYISAYTAIHEGIPYVTIVSSVR